MENIEEIKEQKIIETVCPLPMDILKQYFENKENTSFKINYKGGKLDADSLMIYLSNLNLNADFDEATYEDRDALKELVAAYMKTTTALVDIKQLAREALAICCQHRNILSPDPNNDEECADENSQFKYYAILNNADDFIEENKEMVERWCSMLDSSSVFNMSCLNEPLYDKFIDETFEKIDDPDWVGINYVNLFDLDWIGYYIGYPGEEENRNPKYFVNQFNEYRFKGKNMLEYFNKESNTLCVLTQVIDAGGWDETLPEEFKHFPEGYTDVLPKI
tara:strand:+ start:313 stop:1143 length:831 start_codon:yes stop_codon:yes gene_type:complete